MRAVGADLAGVDLLVRPGGGLVVLEVDGAVDFDRTDSLAGRDVYVDAAAALALQPAPSRSTPPPRSGTARDDTAVSATYRTRADAGSMAGRPVGCGSGDIAIGPTGAARQKE